MSIQGWRFPADICGLFKEENSESDAQEIGDAAASLAVSLEESSKQPSGRGEGRGLQPKVQGGTQRHNLGPLLRGEIQTGGGPHVPGPRRVGSQMS